MGREKFVFKQSLVNSHLVFKIQKYLNITASENLSEILLGRKLHKLMFGFIIIINIIFFIHITFDFLPMASAFVNKDSLESNFICKALHYAETSSFYIQIAVAIILVFVYLIIDIGSIFLKIDKKKNLGEYYFYLTASSLFLIILIKAVHLLTVFLAFVGFGLSSYLILSFCALSNPTNELLLKYFAISVGISMMLGVGMFLFVFAFNNPNINFIEVGERFRLIQNDFYLFQTKLNAFPVYMTLVILSYLAKANIAPFHW